MWIASDNVLLSAAIGASLATTGWRAVQLLTEGRLARATRAGLRTDRLVLVADERGRLPDPGAALDRPDACIVLAVGTRAALAALAAVAERHPVVAALDADQPFTELIGTLDAELRGSPAAAPGPLPAALRARDGEAHRFTDLTPREREVLGELVTGRSATQIALAGVIALPTVRSHIRAVLAKLGVSSQLSAVALAHRSCREWSVVRRMREVHQF